MTNIIRYRGENPRLFSPNIWGNCPAERIQRGYEDGFFFFDDFYGAGAALSTNISAWTGPGGLRYSAHGTTGVTWNADDGAAGAYTGLLKFDVDADDEEAYLTLDDTYNGVIAEISDTAGNNFKFWFETRVKFDNVDSGAAALGKFVGMAENGSDATGTIFGADAATSGTKDTVGFRAFAADGNGMDAVFSDGTTEVVHKEAANNDSLDITADTFKKFGLYYDGTTLFYYVDGVLVDADGVLPSATSFPDATKLMPCFGGRQHGTGDFEGYIDWWGFSGLHSEK